MENIESYPEPLERDYENIEGTDEAFSLSDLQSEYLNEAVETGDQDFIVARADEINDAQPPKAIDSNPEMAEIIEPVKDSIDSKYLEAPSDIEQIEGISDYLSSTDELKFENWKNLSLEERHRVLQAAEFKIAEIEHRDFCGIDLEKMPQGNFGSYSLATNRITLNEYYVMDNNPESFKECLDTLIHEGRHAYQDYNLNEREVHPDNEDVAAWYKNLKVDGYENGLFTGFEAYYNQPIEKDAREFAEGVLDNYYEKLA